jgi:hypothetical protein
MGMAAEAITWSILMCSRTPMRVARTHGLTSRAPSNQVMALPFW